MKMKESKKIGKNFYLVREPKRKKEKKLKNKQKGN